MCIDWIHQLRFLSDADFPHQTARVGRNPFVNKVAHGIVVFGGFSVIRKILPDCEKVMMIIVTQNTSYTGIAETAIFHKGSKVDMVEHRVKVIPIDRHF